MTPLCYTSTEESTTLRDLLWNSLTVQTAVSVSRSNGWFMLSSTVCNGFHRVKQLRWMAYLNDTLLWKTVLAATNYTPTKLQFIGDADDPTDPLIDWVLGVTLSIPTVSYLRRFVHGVFAWSPSPVCSARKFLTWKWLCYWKSRVIGAWQQQCCKDTQ